MSGITAPFDIRLEETPAPLTNQHCLASIALHRDSSTTAIKTGLMPLNNLSLYENWYTKKPVCREQHERLSYAFNEDLMLGYAYLHGPQFGENVFAIYQDILQLLTQHNYVLLRVWNYLPQLTESSDYQTFCSARAQAFTTLKPSFYCAATVIGTGSDSGVIYFIGAPTPGIAINNPRQTPPHLYPEYYVTPSPMFSRATLKQWQDGTTHLYVSGTAAIVGHSTVHHDKVAVQLDELAQNITILFSEAAKIDERYRKTQLNHLQHTKLYIARQVADNTLKTLGQRYFGDTSQPQIFNGQMCRADLLVEAEGMIVL